MSESRRFIDPRNARFEVSLHADALQAMIVQCAASKSKETGGILIGRLNEGCSVAMVLEATSKPSDSGFGWAWFRRGAKGLRELLIERWNSGQHYLGEWHYHPGGSCMPSGPDHTSMREIATNPRYECREPLLIILGGDPPIAYDISITVFPRGESGVTLVGSKY